MSEWKIDERQIIEMNQWLAKFGESVTYNVIHRTIQESKLFPLTPYITMSWIDAYYRYPDLVRLISSHMSPEEMGHRLREGSGSQLWLQRYCSLMWYPFGRQILLSLGVIQPWDHLEDMWDVYNYTKRVYDAYNREFNFELPHDRVWADKRERLQILPERTIQVLESDLRAVRRGSPLLEAVKRFSASTTQWAFLGHAECRLGVAGHHGPYRIDENVQLLVKQWSDLGQNTRSWLDDTASGIPYNNITLVLATSGVDFEVNDWGDVWSHPEYYLDNVIGVGLYTNDQFTEGYIPVGMESDQDLLDALTTFTHSTEKAVPNLYRRFASMNSTQMTDTGNFEYFQVMADWAKLAGCYHQGDWEFVDERTERFRPILNEEFSRDLMGAWYLANKARHQNRNEYYIHPTYPSDLRARGSLGPLIPTHVLMDHDYSRRVNPEGLSSCVGQSSLPSKAGSHQFLRGLLDEKTLNAEAKLFKPALVAAPYVHLDDQWARFHSGTPLADDLYSRTQQRARIISGRGSTLRRQDIDEARRQAGEPTLAELSQELEAAKSDVPDA